MLQLANALVVAAINHADLALTSREHGDHRAAARHERNADKVAGCASKAGTSYVVEVGGDPLSPALALLEGAETYGREATCFGGRV